MILPFSGTMMFLHYEKGRARRHMEKILKKKEIGEAIALSLALQEYSALRWEHEYEFEHKGEMYDLISKESKGSMIILHCIHDKKETSINKSIVKFIAGFLNSNPFHDQQLAAFSDFTKQLAPIARIKTHIMSALNAMLTLSHISLKARIGFFDPSIPPPKHS